VRIAFLSFYSGRIDRGVEVATSVIASKLSKNHEIWVFQAGKELTTGVKTQVLEVEHKWPQDSSNSYWRKFYLDYFSLKILIFTLKFLPYFFKQKYDVIIPTNGGWQVLIIRMLTKIYGKKMIVQGNAGIGRDDQWQLRLNPDRYIAISPQGYIWAQKKAPQVKIVYIPYGVDTKLFSQTKPTVIPLKKPIVLCVAALLEYKRVNLLIEAMKNVSQASLMIIGHGPLEKQISKLGSELLGSRFLLKTNINHDDLIGYYKGSDLFSLPSRSSEAFGIVYVEAMAAGLPIVAPDDLNRHEIIGKAGIFIDPENTQDYANAIKNGLAQDNSQKSLNQARKFDWEVIAKSYQKLLEEL
jgi:glycosyltransferase involved in cell wall biosynthesis